MRTAASVLLLYLCGFVSAADPAGLQLFEQKIRPVLVEHCYSCHSADAKKLRGGLRVDSRAALLKGGEGAETRGQRGSGYPAAASVPRPDRTAADSAGAGCVCPG